MQQAVHGHARRVGVPLAMRVGLALGDVTREASDLFGTPVVEAARLVAAAALHDAARANVLRELLRPFPEHVVQSGGAVLGSLAHTRGLLAATVGDVDEAVDHFGLAEATHDPIGVPAWLQAGLTRLLAQIDDATGGQSRPSAGSRWS